VVVGVGSAAAGEGKDLAGLAAEGAWWCSSCVRCCGNSVLASGAWGGVVGAAVLGIAGCHQQAWVGQLDVVRRANQVLGAVEVGVVGVQRVLFGLRASGVVGDSVLTWRRWARSSVSCSMLWSSIWGRWAKARGVRPGSYGC
jgi:hypothetical protein